MLADSRPARRRLLGVGLVAVLTVGLAPGPALAATSAPASFTAASVTAASFTAASSAPAASPPAPSAPDRTRVTDATISVERFSFIDHRARFRHWDDTEVRVRTVEGRSIALDLITGEEDRGDDDWQLVFRTDEPIREGVRYTDPFDSAQSVEHRGEILMENGSRTDCAPWGSFEVLHHDPAAERLRLVFEARCVDTLDPAVHGEVRVDVPTRTVGGVTSTDLHRWPDAEVGEKSRRTYLVLHNDGPRPARLGTAYVTGRDREDLVIYGQQCDGVIDPGEICSVDVAHRPRGVGDRRSRLHVPVSVGSDGTGGAGELLTRLRAAGIGGVTGGVITSVPARGQAVRTKLEPSDHVVLRRVGDGIYLNMTGLRATLFPAPGDRLVPGRYDGAVRYPFQEETEPGITWNSFDTQCPESEQKPDHWFEIHEITYDDAGQPTSLAFTVRLSCGRAEQRAYFAFRADEMPPAPVVPSVSVSTDQKRYDRGDIVRVRVQVRPVGLSSPVTLRHRDARTGALFRYQPRQRFPDENGVVSYRIKASKTGRLGARLDEETVRVAGRTQLRVRPTHVVEARMRGAVRRDGRTHVYAPGRRAHAVITVDPPSGQCLDVAVRVWSRGGWRHSKQGRQCLEQDRDGRVVYHSRSRVPTGLFRLIALHPYDRDLEDTSRYQYVRLRS